MTHAWCRDIPRDEAVRAAEDGRIGPLPTLEEAIASTTNHDAPPGARVSDSQCAGHADTGADTAGAGLRTERVTLEIRHVCAYPAAEWLLEIAQDTCSDPGEYVRVVEECCLDRINMGEVIRERDAAIRERQKAEQRADRDFVKCSALADKVLELRARVAELESAPAARGWLTEDERRLIEIAVKAQRDPYDITGTSQHNARVLRNLLARTTPPEVVLPPMPDCSPMADYGAAWRDCLIAVRESLRLAGVNMQQPLPPEPEANG